MSKQELIRSTKPDWKFPDFEELRLAKKKNKYCVCIFVINEGERVRTQLKKMKSFSNEVDIVVADGGSTDGSLDEEFLKGQGVRALLTKRGKGKLSAQMRMAFAWALNEGYEGVIVVDGNNKDSVENIPDFVKLLNEGYDHIQGSRFIPGGKAINTPLSRELGLHLLHAPLISLAAGERHTDTTNGFRAYSARLLKDDDIAVFRDVFQTYELHYYLAIESSRRKQYKTVETPVVRAYPKGEKTPTKISPLKGNIHILKVLLYATLGAYKKDSIAPWSTLLWAITLLVGVLSIILFYPGLASLDTLAQWYQVVGVDPVSDWHPPVMVYLWKALYHISHKMGALFILQLALFWLSTGLFARYIYKLTHRRWLSLIPFLIALSPPILSLTGVIWKDIQLAVALFAAMMILIYARYSDRFTVLMRILSMVLIVYAALTRYNALAAAVPIIFLWIKTAWPNISIRRTLCATVAVPIVVVAISMMINIAGGVVREHPTTAVMLDDIIGTRSSTDYNYAPTKIRVSLLAAESKCDGINPPFNSYWFCIDSSERQLFSRDMHKEFVQTWVRVIADNPLQYFWYRAYAYTAFLFGFGENQYIYAPYKIVEVSPGIYTATEDKAYSTKILNIYTFNFAQRSFGIVFRPWLWLLLALIILYFYSRRRQKDLSVLVLVTSSIIYILSYIPVAVATDYRYIYWSVISTMMAFCILFVNKNDGAKE